VGNVPTFILIVESPVLSTIPGILFGKSRGIADFVAIISNLQPNERGDLVFATTLLAVLFIPLFHTGYDGGIFAGLLHPILGIDHLLAMVTVGLLSAQMGGRAIWTVPAAFVSVMAVGGVLGILGVPLPFVEYGIALSVVALGLALAARKNLPIGVAMAFVGVFALFHGHAHGTELPTLSETVLDVVAYVFGFLVATAGLHLVGALIGQIAVGNPRGAKVLRVSGAVIALVGVFLVIGI
jgi:urease accessory protein